MDTAPGAGRAIHVMAGALIDGRGRVLIAERPPGKALAGRWEFPGGKLAAGESPRDALRRELAEELGIEMGRAMPLLAVSHHYPGAAAPVLIDCWRVESWRGEPAALDGQRLRWCTRAELAAADILEADRPIVTALILPPLFVHLEPAESVDERLMAGRGRTAWLAHAMPTDPRLLRRLAPEGDALFIIDPDSPLVAGVGTVYTSARWFEPALSRQAPAGRVVHGAREAHAAARAGADFLLVPSRRLSGAQLAGIAAAGLPWYRNLAGPGDAAADEVTSTGRLSWTGLPTDRR